MLLESFVSQYETAHGIPPAQIVVTPLAVLAVAIKETLERQVVYKDKTIPVVSREFSATEVTAQGAGTKLGLFVKDMEQVVAVDLL